MAHPLESKTISIWIDTPPERAYDFVSNPENLPRWASGLSKSIRNVNGQWLAETPLGPATVRFAERNGLGVLDHYVRPTSQTAALEIHVPMRVLPNGGGSEVFLTLFRYPGMSAERFAEDEQLVRRDLAALKRALEGA